jgi:hypothetical protein
MELTSFVLPLCLLICSPETSCYERDQEQYYENVKQDLGYGSRTRCYSCKPEDGRNDCNNQEY